MKKTKDPLNNVIRFPVEAVPKFGHERVRKLKKPAARRMQTEGQLDLFPQPTDQTGEVVEFPTSVTPFEQALFLDERGDAEAEEHYRRAISEGDNVADAYCNLGVMASRDERTTEAFDCFKSALKHDPRHFESHFNVANLYFESGELRPARLHYEVAAELEPDFPNVYFNLGLVEAMCEDYDTAIAALTRYEEMAPPDEARKADELLSSLKQSVDRHS
jgi:tetratricopeptide (TPR) repeat protein